MKPSEYHACATGDCTHETQAECTAAMIALADDQAQEIDRLTAELAAIREAERERKAFAARVFEQIFWSTNPEPRPVVVPKEGESNG